VVKVFIKEGNMVKYLLLLIMSVECYSGALFANNDVPIVEGSLTFTFYPKGTVGTGGTWQPCVITPGGKIIEGGEIAYDVMDPVIVEVSCCQSQFVELGCYGILLRNRIEGSSNDVVLSSITVFSNTPSIPFDEITYKNVSPSSINENVLMYYALPLMQEE
jgi:hypothetical protein